ncbi:PEGA domain-containing protein [candidate division KSB1 bacterium]|nr:PEGA domain-containing protein [candidate division KSB1 bacterium]
MRRILIALAVVVLGCSKAEIPLGPARQTTLEVIAIDVNGSEVDSADVFLDGVKVGVTPYNSQDVQPGLRALRVTQDGFRVYSEQLVVVEGGVYVIEAVMEPLPPDQGQLLVSVNLDSTLVQVLNASNWLVAETYDKTSVHFLPPGDYLVTGRKEGFPTVEEAVEIHPSQTTTVNLELDTGGGGAPALAFSIVEDTVKLGEPINLTWQSNGVQVIVDQGVGVRGPNGSERLVCATAGLKVFTATAYSIDNLTTEATDTVYIESVAINPPVLEFDVLQDSVEFGEPVFIQWQTDGFQVVIDQGVGTRGPAGSEEVNFEHPGKKVFTATAYGQDNLLTVMKDSVYIKDAPLPPHPVVMLSTTRMVTVNTPATISWQSQNADYVVVDFVSAAGLEGAEEITFTTPGIRIVTATAFNQRGYTSTSDTIEVVEPEVDTVDDILVAANVSVRADKGESGYVARNAGTFFVETAGKYRVLAEVWYNSGDSQRNESYYLDIEDDSGSTILPRDPNAGIHKVVPDDPGDPHTVPRKSGVFKLSEGEHAVNVYHYAKIADVYTQFINDEIDGPESVKLLGFKLVYVGE